MNPLPALCPQSPEWRVAWDDIDAAFPWIRNLRGCEQDAINHGEGDVWNHTRLVCESLASIPTWRALDETSRRIVFSAALLHDVAKPATRRVEPDGHVSFPAHSRHGAILSRGILWRLGVPFAEREAICALVRHHLKPFFLAESNDSRRIALEVSQTARCDWLSLLAEADARGRICQDLPRLLENIALFTDFCKEQGCLDRPWPFPSNHTRFLYFRHEWPSPDHAPHQDLGSDVVMLSGLPGSGKDHWKRQHLPDWPSVSLDDLRDEMDIDPEDRQGPVLQAAREQARQYLRAKRSFVWNATNLSRQRRGEVIRLLASYNARVRIVYLEVSEETLRRQNRQRPRPVPQKVIERLLSRWEVPDLTEAHTVDVHLNNVGTGDEHG
jgi:predicted kinase